MFDEYYGDYERQIFPFFQPFGQQQGPPFGRPPSGPPFGQQQGPPFGRPPSSPPFGQQNVSPSSPPSGPPPGFEPSMQTTGGISPLAIDPGAIRPCTNRFVYIWLENGSSFWAWLVFVGPRSVAGWRWTGRRWVYFGVDTRNIDSFWCY